jgi:ParB/RepB/Spo0J family partition protein
LHVNDKDNARQMPDRAKAGALWTLAEKAGGMGKVGKEDLDKYDTSVVRLCLLAESIRASGLENPPIIRAAEPADSVKKPYVLVMGFRRVAALDILGIEVFDARTPSVPQDRKHLNLAALAENLARDNLSPYESAMGANRAILDYKATGEEVARATGMSLSHTNNQVRLVRKLPPTVMDAWKAQHPLAKIDTLLKLAALESPEDIEVAWADKCRGEGVAPTPTAAGGAGAAAGSNGHAKPSRRKTMAIVEACLSLVNSTAKDAIVIPAGADASREWFATFVRYLAGKRATPPDGLSFPKEEKATKAKGKKRGKRQARA